MIINLFSIFDPSSSLNNNFNWRSILIRLIIIPFLYWKTPSRIQLTLFILINIIVTEIKNNINNFFYPIIILIYSLFWFILINNTLGLYPYIFTASRHLVLTISLAFPLWLTIILYGWVKTWNKIFIHLVPLNTPIQLSTFIVLIETISNTIRPFTLSIRLIANIIAGHLLMSFLRGLPESSPYLFYFTFLALIILLFLEIAVAIIQRYVFITLISLYINEIN